MQGLVSMLHLFPTSSLHFLTSLLGHLMHNSVTNISVIQALFFDLGSTQSQILDCAEICPPLPFYQDWVAVDPTA